MLARVLKEQRLEVGAARGQDHLVGLHRVSVTGQGHVHEGLALQQLIEDVGQIGLVVVPSQAELLRRSRHVVVHVGRSALLQVRKENTTFNEMSQFLLGLHRGSARAKARESAANDEKNLAQKRFTAHDHRLTRTRARLNVCRTREGRPP